MPQHPAGLWEQWGLAQLLPEGGCSGPGAGWRQEPVLPGSQLPRVGKLRHGSDGEQP